MKTPNGEHPKATRLYPGSHLATTNVAQVTLTNAARGRGPGDLSPVFPPGSGRVLGLMLRSPILDRRRLEFSGSDHGGGLVAPSGICRSIGTLYPIALWGLTSL